MTDKLQLVEVADEDGQLHYFPRDIYEPLRAVGLIFGDPPTFNSAEIDLKVYPELALCDFCFQRPVVWDIDAETFTLDEGLGPTFTSIEGWAACEACGRAIADGDRATLQRRTLVAAASRHDARRGVAPYLVLATELLEMLELFWQHYRGIHRLEGH